MALLYGTQPVEQLPKLVEHPESQHELHLVAHHRDQRERQRPRVAGPFDESTLGQEPARVKAQLQPVLVPQSLQV